MVDKNCKLISITVSIIGKLGRMRGMENQRKRGKGGGETREKERGKGKGGLVDHRRENQQSKLGRTTDIQ